MATAHSLSVVTNSCVRRPRNPKTNLPETTLESEAYKNNGLSNGSFAGSNSASKDRQNGREYFAQSHMQRNGVGGTNTWEEDALIDQLTNDVENITSDEFYERLRELKDKHRVTLSSLEARYNQKLSKTSRRHAEFDVEDDDAGDGNGYVDDWSLSLKYMNGIDEVKGMTRSGPVYVAEHKHKHLEDEVNRFNQSLPAWSALPKDNVRDMSSKPPSGRPAAAAWTDRPPSRSKSRAESKSKPKPDWTEVTWSSDGECSATTEEIISSVNASLDLSLSKQPGSPAVVVDSMWDDFSVDSYAPRSRSMSRSSARSNSTQNTKSKEWAPKITIPKPFTMTLRESSEERKKSRAAMELDEERLDREKQEEVECQIKFKAQPVPAHTFLPLYDELIDQQVEKSRKNKEVCKEKLLTTQKPFKLTESKTPPRPKSASSSTRKMKTPQFKAKPVPKSVFDPTVDDQILEEEEYRKIRIKMRAEEMLRQSSLPPNMQIRGKEYTDGKMRMKMRKSREKKAFLTTDHKFQPQVNGEIPDYDELYRRFQEEVHEKKREKEPTVFEPFNLRTARIPSRKGKIMAEMEEEERRRRESLRGSLSKSASLRRSIDSGDSLPSKTTTSNELRKSATLKTMMSQAQKEKIEQEKEQRQRYKQRKLAKSIAGKARANDTSQSLETTNLEKIRQHKLAERAREEEYQRELQEMMARIETRPLLFERERELNAKKRAERKYESALRSAGISEDFLERKGRSGGGAASTSYASDRGGDDDKSDASYNYDKDYDDDDDFGRSSSSEASET